MGDYRSISATDEAIKRAILQYGPVTGGIYSWWHFMVIVGWREDTDTGETEWLYKNSWGTSWGEDGYAYVKVDLSDMYGLYSLQNPLISHITPYTIACNDFDGDEYYNWGLSEQAPSSCPSDIPTQNDCDDSDPNLYLLSTSGRCTGDSFCYCEVYESSIAAHEASGRAYSQEESCGWNCTETAYYATGSNENLGTDGNAEVTLYSSDQGATWSTTQC